MRLLGISGTPRVQGNSELLLKEAMKPFGENGWESRLIKVRDLKLQQCRGCDACGQNGFCVLDDDMKQIYEAFAWCDALLLATPVYYRNVNARLLTALERHYALLPQKILSGKAGAAIATGRGDGQATALSALYTWMLSCGIICVPGELNGLTAVASEPGDVLLQPKKLAQARVLGENLRSVAERLKGGVK